MSVSAYTGVIPPVVTPFNEDFSIDRESLATQVRRMIDAGVDGLFALGSSAEVAFLTRENRRAVIETIVKAADGKVPVLVGVIDTTTLRVAEHVADAVELPLYLYQSPVSVHIAVSDDLILQLAEEGVIAGLKDSSGLDGATRALIEKRNARNLTNFKVLTGSETTVDLNYFFGADGVVPGLGNVDPAGYVRLAAACTAGDWDAARAEQQRLNKLFQIVFVGDGARMGGSSAGLGGFKAALQHLGVFTSGRMAPPHVALNDEELATIHSIVDQADLN